MLRFIDIVVLILLSINMFVFAAETEDTHAPHIFCEQPTYDFGKRDNSSKVEHTFLLKNTGDIDLVIKRVKPACGCTIAKLSNKEIAPGESASLKTVLSLKGRHGHQRKSIRVQSNDPQNPNLLLYLKGNAVREIEINPGHLNFRLQSQTNSATKFVKINSAKPLVISKAISSSEFFVPSLEHIENQKKYKLTVISKSPIPKDCTSAKIKLICENHQDIVIPVTAICTGPLSFAPKTLAIRSVNNRPVTRYIMIRAGKTKKFKLLDVGLPNKKIKSSISSLGNSGYRIKLTDIPPLKELNGKRIVIKTDVTAMPVIEIPFKVYP